MATTKAQDPVEVAPEVYRIALDTDRARVMDVRVKPGAHVPMHSHAASIVYACNDSILRFTFPDGHSRDIELRAGDSFFNDSFAHEVDNPGSVESHVLIVELKG